MEKIFPQAIEVEEAIIGAIIMYPCIIKDTIEIMPSGEMFYFSKNGIIYDVMVNMFEDDVPIDLLTLHEKLKHSGKLEEIGGMFYVTGLATNIGSPKHVVQYTLIVRDKYIKRLLIKALEGAQNDAYDDMLTSKDIMIGMRKQLNLVYHETNRLSDSPKNIMSMESCDIIKDKNVQELMKKLDLDVTGEVVGGNKIAVIDIETTGFLNQGGSIIEIGIVELDMDSGETKVVFNSLCREPILSAKHRTAPFGWIFENSDLSADDVRRAPLSEDVFPAAQYVLNKYPIGCTAFNKAFDFGFLKNRGFKIIELDCPMMLLTPIMKLPNKNGRRGNKWPSVEEAWRFSFPGIEYKEEHRGADDAMHEAKIIYELYKNGNFKI